MGSDESAYLALRHRVPDRDVAGRACANANETLAGVPQLRCGKCPRIRGLSCGNGAEPSDRSCH